MITFTSSSSVSSIPVLGFAISTIPTSAVGVLVIYTVSETISLEHPAIETYKFGIYVAVYPDDVGNEAS